MWGEMVSLAVHAPTPPPVPPPATDPYRVKFSLYLTPTQRAAQTTFGGFVERIKLFRNGGEVPDCVEGAPPYSDDPCVVSRVYNATTGNADISVATTRFSTWTFAAPAPVPDAGGPYAATEGTPVQLSGSVANVPEGAATLEWGPGGQFDDPAVLAPVYTPLDDGTETVLLSAVAAEQTGSDQAEITVANADPVIDSLTAAPASTQAGTPVEATVTFHDPGVVDTHTVEIDWGDGTPADTQAGPGAGGGSVAGSHTYAAAGTYTVAATVSDDDGGVDTAETTVTVTAGAGDTVTLGVSGAISYTNSGQLSTGDVTIARNTNASLRAVTGSGTMAGAAGGEASVSFDARRFFVLPVFLGRVTVSDPGAGLNLNTPLLFTSVSSPASNSASARHAWVDFGRWPWKPYTLTWTVVDTD